MKFDDKDKNLFALILCFAFLLICFNYSLKTNLWGDEAYSLQVASQSWQQIFTNFDVHLPTYYFFLKILTMFFGDSNEIVLRLIHAVLFSGGLFLGYKTILLLSGSAKKSLLILLAATLSPTFIFYATNLRMYAPLFLFSMAYFFVLSLIMVKKDSITKKDWIPYLLVSAVLVLIDYPGILVFLVGSGLMGFKLRKFKPIILAFSPIAILLVYYFHLIPEIQGILTWKTNVSSQTSLSKDTIFELAKWSYSALSPVFDLFSTSQKSLLGALALPVFFATGLFVSLVIFLFKQKKLLTLNIFIVVCFAFYWLIAIPLGHNLTRAFLPALFFIPAFLLLSTPWLPKMMVKLNVILFTFLLLINSFQVLNPTLRLYSLVPYKTIASEVLAITNKEGINQVYFSDNSLNNLSIKRYLEKTSDSKLHLDLVSSNPQPKLLNQGNFVFVSHMGESNNFVDYKELAKGFQVTNVKNYVRLNKLPYNDLWKKQIEERAFQDYAVSIYLIKK